MSELATVVSIFDRRQVAEPISKAVASESAVARKAAKAVAKAVAAKKAAGSDVLIPEPELQPAVTPELNPVETGLGPATEIIELPEPENHGNGMLTEYVQGPVNYDGGHPLLSMKLHAYYRSWAKQYKEGVIKQVTLEKYFRDLAFLTKNFPSLHMGDLSRPAYQEIITCYAQDHELTTVKDFHHRLHACLRDAQFDGVLRYDPAHKVKLHGKPPREKKKEKSLSVQDLGKLIDTLDLTGPISCSMDWAVLLMAKTGLRFAECLGLTPKDIDFQRQQIHVTKTWNYKQYGITIPYDQTAFTETKNRSSVRVVDLDWQFGAQMMGKAPEIMNLNPDWPIFVPPGKTLYNSTWNSFLEHKCREAGVPAISIHSLRHTNASILLYQGLSLPSIAARLGHTDSTVTQKVYLHVIKELEAKDRRAAKIALSGVGED